MPFETDRCFDLIFARKPFSEIEKVRFVDEAVSHSVNYPEGFFRCLQLAWEINKKRSAVAPAHSWLPALHFLCFRQQVESVSGEEVEVDIDELLDMESDEDRRRHLQVTALRPRKGRRAGLFLAKTASLLPI